MRKYLILLLVFVAGCGSDPVAYKEEYKDLITNVSFEKSNGFSMDEWKANTNDTTLLYASNDVPAGGGNFSLCIKKLDDSISAYVYCKIKPLEGSYQYNFSFFAKATSYPGEVSIGVINSGNISIGNKISISDSLWKEYKFDFNYEYKENDSIIIILKGPLYKSSFSIIKYDLVKFEARIK